MYAKRAEANVVDAGESFTKLVAELEPFEVLFSLAALPTEKQIPNALGWFLREHRPAADGDQSFQNLWYRAVCLYDWLKYSHSKPLGRRPARKAKRKVRAKRKA
jgi:hypothetical protein